MYQLDYVFEKDSTDQIIWWTFTTPLPGAPEMFYRFSIVKDLPHAYANGENSQVVYAEMFWKFFQAVASKTSVHEDAFAPSALTAYPNPACTSLTIRQEPKSLQSRLVIVVNQYGQTVAYAQLTNGETQIPTSTLPSGVYTAFDGTSSVRFEVIR